MHISKENCGRSRNIGASIIANACKLESLESRVLLSAAAKTPVSHLPANELFRPNFQTVGSLFQSLTGGTPNFVAGSSTPQGLSPTQMRDAYGVGPYGATNFTFGGIQADGAGQTIAIVDAYNYSTALNDLNTFSSTFNLPQFNGVPGTPTFTKYGVTNTGLSTSIFPGNDTVNGDAPGNDWEIEEALDIEWAHVMAPKANIDLIEGRDAGDDLYAGDFYAARLSGVVAISNSWGGDEYSGESGDDSNFTTPSGHMGGAATLGGTDIPGSVTFLFSTGDSGAFGGTTATQKTVTAQFPASSPNAFAIGGTSLSVSGNSYNGETAWGSGATSWNQFGGGGGGISTMESQPSWQTSSGLVSSYSTSKRTYPDISIEGDPNAPQGSAPIYDTYDFGAIAGQSMTGPWAEYGGTSLSCPMMAGMVALADQDRAIHGLGSLDGPSQTMPRVYQLGANANAYTTDFRDVTSGSNGPSTPINFTAKAKYDLTSGVGSPMANNFVPDLAQVTTAPTISSVVINGDIASLIGTQRSMVEDVAYTFSAGVTITNANLAFTVVGAGPNPGVTPATLSAAAVAGTSGTEWEVTLTGQSAGTLASIANGEYSITINPAFVVASSDGLTALAAGRTDKFFRLYGDSNGDEVVNAADNLKFKAALNAYNPVFDVNGDGTVNAADNLQFKNDLSIGYNGDGFVPTI